MNWVRSGRRVRMKHEGVEDELALEEQGMKVREGEKGRVGSGDLTGREKE